ncbi:hypothetical protein RJT34_31647 [Clitoria ternatea]|uniref:NAD-dependent epimerase/dehydratase domain-containing protein n=1 Tax=Clitoria ternatea TaxID=43366 RepID=A0AAN9EUN0_CLITE
MVVVCVTGASGFIASWIVKFLLHRGYTVRATVRDPASPVLSVVQDPQLWYTLSKTLAESAAWKFVRENNIDMVAINPSVVIGPLLQPEINASSALVVNLINGCSQTFPNASYGWINVKDVANAHIQAYEIASASGRYCLAERVLHFSQVVKILHDLYPTLQIPEKCEDDKPYEPTFQVSKENAKSLGIEFIPLEVTLRETVESLKENKLIEF